jgi:ADP-ribose pyrophosphatase YjhB (NUDIX family)
MSERHYPDRPLLGVGAALFTRDLDRVLLVRRAAPPARGLWSVPGGLARAGEPLLDACRREVLEETGLEAELGPVAKVVERIIPDAEGRVEYHYLIVDFMGWAEGTPHAASDAGEAAWVRLDDVAALATTRGLKEGLARALELAQNRPASTPIYDLYVGRSP